MKNKISILFLLISLNASCQINKLYVKFGNAKAVLQTKKDGVLRIYFDRWGNIYPDFPLNDSVIEKNASWLNGMYDNNPKLFSAIKKKYHLEPEATKEQLQQEIVNDLAAKINEASKNKQLVFLVHGFNKHPLKPSGASAYDEFKCMREAIENKFPDKSIQFVEIYWDGCTWVNGAKWKEMISTVNVWNNAEAASNAVAIELRRILYRLNNENNIVITHSLGASVITCALFNANKFDLYNKVNSYKKYITDRYIDSTHYQTPIKLFRVGMLAPAIPGSNTFDDYYVRTPSFPTGFANSTFIVGYNIYDPALTKTIGLAKSFGATSLGCLRSEVRNVEDSMNTKERTLIEDVDFSLRADGSKQKIHDFSAYVKNKKPMDLFLDKLFRQ